MDVEKRKQLLKEIESEIHINNTFEYINNNLKFKLGKKNYRNVFKFFWRANQLNIGYRLREICRALALDRGNVHRYINFFEQLGFIKKIKNGQKNIYYSNCKDDKKEILWDKLIIYIYEIENNKKINKINKSEFRLSDQDPKEVWS